MNNLDITAVKTGLDFVAYIGMKGIHHRVNSLIRYFMESLLVLKHANGQPLTRIFGFEHHQKAGGTILLNVFDVRGDQ